MEILNSQRDLLQNLKNLLNVSKESPYSDLSIVEILQILEEFSHPSSPTEKLQKSFIFALDGPIYGVASANGWENECKAICEVLRGEI